MKKIPLLLTILLLTWGTVSLLGQVLTLTGGGKGAPGVAAITPGFVSFQGMPSTETAALGTVVNSTCATRAICTYLVDASASGDSILVFYTYKATANTAHVPTVTDDKGGGSSTYTCVTEANNATNTYYAGLCYSVNVAASIRKITVTWPAGCGTTACTQASAGAMLCYNCPTFDVSAGNSGTSTTTFTSGSATSTADSDYWVQMACATGTPLNTGAWTAGSQGGITWVLDHADRRDGCAIQHGVQTAAGALNPQMTIGSADAFVSIGAAFKSGTSGTAPSGFYIAHIYHYNSAGAGTGPYSVQFPTVGNLPVIVSSGGGATPQKLTGVSDGTNTYTECSDGGSLANGTNQISTAFYAANATTGLLAVTLTTSGTGDLGPAMLYDVVGAATTQTCPFQRYDSTNGTSPTSVSIASLTVLAETGNNSGGIGLYRPGSNNSLTIGLANWGTNTAIAQTSPSGAVFDIVTYGGEPHDGPTSVDQNAGGGHYFSTDNSQQTWTWTLTNGASLSSTNGGLYSFQGAGATLATVIPTYQYSLQSTANAVTISIPIRTTIAGDTIIAGIAAGTSHTVTRVSADAVCTNADFTQATSAASTNGTQRADIWHLLNTAGKSNVCVTYSGSAGTFNKEIKIWIVRGLTAFDTGNHTNAGTGSGASVNTGAAVTTTGSTGFVVSVMTVNNSITLIPDTGNEFKDGGVIWPSTTDGAISFVSSSAATHTPTFHDGSASDSFGSSTAAFK